ncbi:fibronectin type III domain-containing protein [Winogradskyella aquimaris]|uniref:Fibronectin type III domain-containing protein n=1 Tax=Winogradskyella aquimaris TaxID=864074 RepID=A0ABU5EJI1_9FLAO|nr:fibronectin type III domain-containing protein [Winogradskyella aquimaris]MDY2586132.1 fibronectin type III domain-containing protein [Winogradskyella aquimaris]
MRKITLFLFLLSFVAISSVKAQIASFPYTEDFESGDGGWVANNTTNGTWALGTPAGAIINSAASGTNAWVTNLTGNYNSNEDSWVTSPVFDFSSLTAPSIELSIWYDIEFSWDGAVLQSSIDGGTTWVNVGAFGDPNNWYTDNTINGAPGGQQEGWSGTGAAGTNDWVTARHPLTGLGGQANVIFRVAFGSDGSVTDEGFAFDDINIFEVTCPEPTDITFANVTETTADVSWTPGGTETLWNLEWGVAGFTPGTGTLESGLTTTSFSFTSLTTGTSYDVYLVADCGGSSTSSLVGPVTFNTTVPGGSCAAAFPMTVETDCDTATPTTFDFSIAEDIDAAGENPSCDGFGNWGYWVSFTAPPVGSVVFNIGGAGDNIGVEVLDACGGTSLVCINNTLDSGDSSDIIGGLTPGNTYVAVIWRDAQSGTADVCIEEGPTCTFPTNLAATNFTTDGAELSWTENGTATIWNIEVVPSGDAPTGIPTVTGVTNPYTITGLMASTDYDFYVQADCGGGDTSDFSAPFTFTTACDVFTPDYLEQFDTIIPVCWDEADSGDATTGPADFGAGAWGADGFLNNGFSGAYKINLWVATKSDWIISPQFDLTGGPFQVEFDFGIMQFGSSTTAGTLGSDDIVQLLITNDNGATWTPLLTYDSTSVVPATGEHPVVTLEAYAGQTVQFGILGSEGTVDDPEDNDVFVDNFRVRGIPTCPEPTDLTSTNLSLTETEVGWTETGTSTVWNIEYGPAGFTPGTGTLVTGVTTNPFVLTGLTSDTDYDFYVQAECDPTNLSSFAGPGSFYTGYCQSEPTSNDGQGVTNVTIGFTDFPSLGDVTYEDQTSPTVNVFQGIETNVAVTFETGFTYGTNIWIDFNDDLVFDNATELVFSGTSTNAIPTTLDASFVMPLTAPLGVHRMRIGTADTGQATPNPCYNGSWGVTLDFTVNIQELTCTLPEAGFTVNTDCDTDQFFIDVDVTSLGDATSLEISNDFDASTVQATATGVYQAGPFPFGNTVKIFVANEQDNNCTISSDFFEVLACPPDNDECINATVAVVNADESCDTVNPGTILAATPSGVPSGSCTGDPDDDVWFEFTAVGDQQIIDIQNITGGTTNLDHALYEGDCGSLTEIYCSDDTFSLTPSLVIGNTYYIRIFSASSNSETSTFDLCISTLGTPTYCLDTLPICADPTIQYESIVGDQVAPPYLDYDCLFSQPDPQWNTINFDVAGDYVFSLDQTSNTGTPLDIDFIVWGPFVNQQDGCVDLLPETIADCSYSATASETITLTNVPANSVYVILITNFSQQAGFYTFTQDSGPPDGTNCDVVCDVSLALEGGEIEDDIEDPITPDETFEFCGFESVELTASTFYSVDEYVWYQDGFVIPDYNQPNLTVTESGTYQVQVLGGICDQSETYFSALVDIRLYDEAPSVEPQNITVCDGPGSDGVEEFDLDALTASLGLGADFVVSYYTSTDDANQALNPVSSPYSSTGETLIIRIEDATAANDGFLGCRQLSEVELVVNERPAVNQPADFIVCDDQDGNVDGETQFDLTSINDEVNTSTDVTITYHASQEDADSNTAPLASPYTSSGETIYVRVEDNNSGCYETTSFNLEVNLSPLASFDPTIEYEVCPNATVPITIGIVPENFTEADVTVTWLLDGVEIPGSNGLTLDTVLVSGDYSAEITFNATGCTNAITNFVEEVESCIFPEGISPGVSPGLNDRFDLSSFNVVKLEIFNRNGTLVYSKNNYVDEWEGQTNDGEELPVGTYFYTVIYEGGAKQRSAWVYINR